MTLLSIINDTSSTIVLECTKGHIVKAKVHFVSGPEEIEVSYKKGDRYKRNCIKLKPGHWKIAAKKYQK